MDEIGRGGVVSFLTDGLPTLGPTTGSGSGRQIGRGDVFVARREKAGRGCTIPFGRLDARDAAS